MRPPPKRRRQGAMVMWAMAMEKTSCHPRASARLSVPRRLAPIECVLDDDSLEMMICEITRLRVDRSVAAAAAAAQSNGGTNTTGNTDA
jgi:hypothetical protein